MLVCHASGCPTQGKPFLMAGGDATTGDPEEDEFLSMIAKGIGGGLKAEVKVKEIEEKLQELREENLKLKELLQKHGIA